MSVCGTVVPCLGVWRPDRAERVIRAMQGFTLAAPALPRKLFSYFLDVSLADNRNVRKLKSEGRRVTPSLWSIV